MGPIVADSLKQRSPEAVGVECGAPGCATSVFVDRNESFVEKNNRFRNGAGGFMKNTGSRL